MDYLDVASKISCLNINLCVFIKDAFKDICFFSITLMLLLNFIKSQLKQKYTLLLLLIFAQNFLYTKTFVSVDFLRFGLVNDDGVFSR